MRALDLAIKDLRQLARDRQTAIFLVVMPVVFTLMFGFAFGGMGSGEEDPRLPVGWMDLDKGAPLSAGLRQLLETSGVVRLVPLEPSETTPDDASLSDAARQVQEGELAAALIVPAGYSRSYLAGQEPRLEMIVDQAESAGLAAWNEIQLAAARLAGAVQAARLSAKAFQAQAESRGAVALDGETERAAFLEETIQRALLAWQDPPLTVDVRQGAALGGEEVDVMQSGFSHMSPSMMVQFAIAGLIGAASILVIERKSGALRRLLTTAISRTEIILGHYLAMVLMILGQLAILIAFGQLALGVDYMREPVATILVAVATALWSAALGLLIGVLAQSDDHVVIYSLVAMFLLAGLGGAWVPLEFTAKTFQAIGRLLPSAWAMNGFENIVIRGLSLESVLLGVAIMLGYAVGILALAVWRFRFE